MSNLQRTPIVNSAGVATHVWKLVGREAASRTARIAALDHKPVDPNAHPAMQKQVRYQGDVMSYGELLNKVQAVAIRQRHSYPDTKITWSAVFGDDETSVTIPAAVAKASGLPDVTDPLDLINGERDIIQMKVDKLDRGMLNSPGTEREVRELRGKMKQLETQADEIRVERHLDDLAVMNDDEFTAVVNSIYAGNAFMQAVYESGDDDRIVEALTTDKARDYFPKKAIEELVSGSKNAAVRNAAQAESDRRRDNQSR